MLRERGAAEWLHEILYISCSCHMLFVTRIKKRKYQTLIFIRFAFIYVCLCMHLAVGPEEGVRAPRAGVTGGP